jgi:hypothetical protein
MKSSTSTTPEHAFVPPDDTMTVIFASIEKARRASSALVDAGIGPEEVELITTANHQLPDMESPALRQDSPGPEAFDEILSVFTESFSDDEKAYAAFDRALAAGGALLSVPMTGRERRRAELASLLRSHGASAIYYWGALATERL